MRRTEGLLLSDRFSQWCTQDDAQFVALIRGALLRLAAREIAQRCGVSATAVMNWSEGKGLPGNQSRRSVIDRLYRPTPRRRE